MNELRRRWQSAATAAALGVGVATAAPAGADVTNEALLRRIEALQQQVMVLERRLELQDETARTAAASTPVVKAGPRGFSLQSADGQNSVRLRSVVHIDGRFFDGEDPTGLTDTWQATRVRPIIEGTLGNVYDFRVTPDFGQGRTVIQDAYVTARLDPKLAVTAGKFKPPVGLERLQSANDLRFVARAFPTALVPNRDIGVQVAGKLFDDRLDYAVAWTNGAIDGGSSESLGDVDVNDGKEWAARLFALPFGDSKHFALRGLGFGVAGTYSKQDGTVAQPLLPTFRTPAQSPFFRYRTGATSTLAAGERTRLAPQFYYYVGPFGLLGEYTTVSQEVARSLPTGLREDTLDTTAWQLQASWFLTGEEEGFRGYRPDEVFSLANHTWGGFELVARYHVLDPDDDAFVGDAASFADPAVAARKAAAWGLGLNWYLNENLKWVLNYEQTSFDGGAPNGADREDEQVFLTRFALGF
jgi:phosphate-selective porin OprO/OprP